MFMKFSGGRELLISQQSLHVLDIPLIRICLRCFYSETSLTPLTHSIGICICIVFACVVNYLFVLYLYCICICIVEYPYLSWMFLFRDQLTTSHPLNWDLYLYCICMCCKLFICVVFVFVFVFVLQSIRICLGCFYSETSLTPLTHSIQIVSY